MKNPFPFTNVVQKKKKRRLYTHTHSFSPRRMHGVLCFLTSLKSSSIFSKIFNDTPSGASGGTRHFFEGEGGKQRS